MPRGAVAVRLAAPLLGLKAVGLALPAVVSAWTGWGCYAVALAAAMWIARRRAA